MCGTMPSDVARVDHVEVRAGGQRPGFLAAAIRPVRLQVGARLPGQLLPPGPGRKARQAAHGDQRVVSRDSGRKPCLAGYCHRRDRPPVGREMELIDPAEELEPDAAPEQRLIQRGEHHLSHAGPHLPEDGTAVLEEQLRGQEEAKPGGEPRTFGIAALVGEHQVVHPAHERGAERFRRGAVAGQPLAEIQVVDCREAVRVGEQAVPDRAPRAGQHQPGRLPQPPGGLVTADPVGPLPVQPVQVLDDDGRQRFHRTGGGPEQLGRCHRGDQARGLGLPRHLGELGHGSKGIARRAAAPRLPGRGAEEDTLRYRPLPVPVQRGGQVDHQLDGPDDEPGDGERRCPAVRLGGIAGERGHPG